MAVLAVQTITEAGVLNPTLTAASAGGDSFPNDDRTFLYVDNAGGVTLNITITAQKASVAIEGHGDVPLANATFQLLTTEIGFIALPPAIYNAGGVVNIAYDQVASVSVGVFRREAD